MHACVRACMDVCVRVRMCVVRKRIFGTAELIVLSHIQMQRMLCSTARRALIAQVADPQPPENVFAASDVISVSGSYIRNEPLRNAMHCSTNFCFLRDRRKRSLLHRAYATHMRQALEHWPGSTTHMRQALEHLHARTLVLRQFPA